MAENYQTIEYKDEVLADKTVCRTYQNGRIEWRRKMADGRIEWRDNSTNQGIDELLADGIVKRVQAGSQPIYAREQGYGRTLWSNNVLTVNRTSFGGKLGTALAAIGGAFLLGSLIAPPIALAAQEEEELRQRALAEKQPSDAGTTSSDGGDSSWDSGDDYEDESDFG